MKSNRRKQTTISPYQLIIALMVLLSVSLSLTAEVFADHCEDPCHSESQETDKESNQDCDDCLCCLPAIKVIGPAESASKLVYGPVSRAELSDPLNNISAPPDDIDHPPQILQ